MKTRRYFPESGLPRAASTAQIETILAALEGRNYKLYGNAQIFVVRECEMTTASFIEAIKAHLKAGYRIFQKLVTNPPKNTLLYHANVGLYPDFDNEDDDVYVEIRLENQTVVILCNAHEHDPGPRYPKYIHE